MLVSQLKTTLRVIDSLGKKLLKHRAIAIIFILIFYFDQTPSKVS